MNNEWSFWLVQDKVPAGVIQAFTSTCAREDCCISYRTLQTTLAGKSDYYDKNGNLNISNNNTFTGGICCRSCWRGGVIDNNGNMIKEVGPK